MLHIKRQVLCSVLLSLVIFLLINCQSTGTESTKEETFILERDIVYGSGDDVELLLNIARPSTGKGPFPALIFLYGGWYAFGSRTNFDSEIIEAAKRGYVTAAIDYRLTKEKLEDGKSKYSFPAQIHDGKCAVRWLKANSNEYKIDKNRIGIIGFSAGGHLALMLGLADSSDGLEGECGDVGISSRVHAVVNLAGLADLVMTHSSRNYFIEALLGGNPEQVPERYKAGSPLTYVTPDDPPVLTICGIYDALLPQQKILDDRMKAVGASHTLIIIESAGHSMSIVNFSQDNPVWDFLDKHLKKIEK